MNINRLFLVMGLVVTAGLNADTKRDAQQVSANAAVDVQQQNDALEALRSSWASALPAAATLELLKNPKFAIAEHYSRSDRDGLFIFVGSIKKDAHNEDPYICYVPKANLEQFAKNYFKDESYKLKDGYRIERLEQPAVMMLQRFCMQYKGPSVVRPALQFTLPDHEIVHVKS